VRAAPLVGRDGDVLGERVRRGDLIAVLGCCGDPLGLGVALRVGDRPGSLGIVGRVVFGAALLDGRLGLSRLGSLTGLTALCAGHRRVLDHDHYCSAILQSHRVRSCLRVVHGVRDVQGVRAIGIGRFGRLLRRLGRTGGR
jgi:hypothetical protein